MARHYMFFVDKFGTAQCKDMCLTRPRSGKYIHIYVSRLIVYVQLLLVALKFIFFYLQCLFGKLVKDVGIFRCIVAHQGQIVFIVSAHKIFTNIFALLFTWKHREYIHRSESDLLYFLKCIKLFSIIVHG